MKRPGNCGLTRPSRGWGWASSGHTVLASGSRRQSLISDIYSVRSMGWFPVNNGGKGYKKWNCRADCTWRLLKITSADREGRDICASSSGCLFRRQVTLGWWLKLSDPQYPHSEGRADEPSFPGSCEGHRERGRQKILTWRLAHSRCSDKKLGAQVTCWAGWGWWWGTLASSPHLSHH